MNRPYSASVKIVDRKGQTLYLRRSPSAPSRAGEYEYPGGHIERGELPKEAALRETREETGIRLREDELRLLSKEQGKRGIHYTYLARVGAAPRVKLSFEHDGHMWSTDQAAKANPNFISRYLAGADTSKMSTEQKAKQAAVGVGTTLALKQAGKTYAVRQAKKAAAKGIALKVAGTAGSKFVPVVGQVMMVVSAAPEVVAMGREDLAFAKESVRALKSAKGVKDVMSVGAKSTTRAFKRMFTVPARTASAAVFGSSTTKMAREAIEEKMKRAPVPAHENAGAFVLKAGSRAVRAAALRAASRPSSLRALQTVARLTPQYIKAAEGTLMPALRASSKWIGAAALATTGTALAVKGAKQQIGELKKPAAQNPSSIQANVAEINKLLRRMPPAWRGQLESNRAKLQVAGAQPHEAPPIVPNAHSVLLALNLNNRGDVSSEAAAGQEPTSGNTVPEDVREAAMEGVRLSHKNDYGGYDFIGVARAIQLAVSPKISDAALNRVRMYFDRKTKQDRLSDQYAQKHGKRYWSWLNWGGDPGARWSRSKRFAELVKENPMKKSKFNPYLVTRGGQAVPRSRGEEQSTWEAAATHAERQEGEGTQYRLAGPDESGYYHIVDRKTGRPTGKYGTSRDSAQEVLKKLVRRTNPNLAAFVAGGRGLRVRDLIQPPAQPASSKAGMSRLRYANNTIRALRGLLGTDVLLDGHEVVVREDDPSMIADMDIFTTDGQEGLFEMYLGENARVKITGPGGSTVVPLLGDVNMDAQNIDAAVRSRLLSVRRVAERLPKSAKKNPAQDLLEQALNQDSAAAYQPKDKELVRKMEAAGFVRILDETPARIRFAATARARASRTPWQKFEPRKKSSEYPGQRNTPDERWDAEHAAEEQAYHSIHRAARLPKSAKLNPSPGFTTESWLADVAGEEWANYDLNRAGIMHYSGSSIPTYRSLYRK